MVKIRNIVLVCGVDTSGICAWCRHKDIVMSDVVDIRK